MVFSTNSDLCYTYLQNKSEKSHGLFGLGWKNQEHTVNNEIRFKFPIKTIFRGALKNFGFSPIFSMLKGAK